MYVGLVGGGSEVRWVARRGGTGEVVPLMILQKMQDMMKVWYGVRRCCSIRRCCCKAPGSMVNRTRES